MIAEIVSDQSGKKKQEIIPYLAEGVGHYIVYCQEIKYLG